MTDTVIKGTGNSRLLKSVPNLRSLAPTTDALIELLIGDGLPVDVSGLQASGVDTFGTDYSKATCLPDSVEQAIWGNTANRNVAQALQQLRSLITTAQNAIPKITTGSYTGTGEKSKTLSFSSRPKLVIIAPYAKITGNTDDSRYTNRIAPAIIFLYGCVNAIGYELLQSYGYLTMDTPLTVTWGDKSVTWSGSATSAYNRVESTYYWTAIC